MDYQRDLPEEKSTLPLCNPAKAQLQVVAENKALAAALAQAPADWSNALTYPIRPGYAPLPKAPLASQNLLYTNYTAVGINPKNTIHRYIFTVHACIEGQWREAASRLRRFHVDHLIKTLEKRAGAKAVLATDYGQTLLSTADLKPFVNVSADPKVQSPLFDLSSLAEGLDTFLPVQIPERDYGEWLNSGKFIFVPGTQPVSLVFSIIGYDALPLQDFVNILSGTSSLDSLRKEEYIQALNIIAGHQAKGDFSINQVGPNKHFDFSLDAEKSAALNKDLTDGLFGRKGAFLSLRPSTGQLLANVHNTASAFYYSVPILQFSLTCRCRSKADGLLIPSRVNNFRRLVRNLRVIVKINTTCKPGKVVDIVNKSPQDYSYRTASGSTITVAQELQQTYGIRVDAHQFCVNIGTPSKPVYFPASMCIILPAQLAKELSSSQQENVSRFAIQKAKTNFKLILENLLPMLKWTSADGIMQKFGFATSNTFVTVPFRKLDIPRIAYYKGSTNPFPEAASWTLRDIALTPRQQPQQQIVYWAYLVIGNLHEDCDINAIANIETQLKKLNVVRSIKGFRLKGTIDNVNYERQLSEILRKDYVGQKYQFLVVFLGGKKTDTPIYNAVKRVCDQECGITNICVLQEKLKPDSKGARLPPLSTPQFGGNLCLKINLKLGGTNQYIPETHKVFLRGLGNDAKSTMMVGLDVTHPPQGLSRKKNPSIVGVVANIDSRFAQWPGKLAVLPPDVEIIEDSEDSFVLKELFASRFECWRRTNAAPPKNIIYFRDGVSEGQYSKIIQYEFPCLKRAFATVYPNAPAAQQPKYSVIVVTKRHHTRFSSADKLAADTNGNCYPGTVVDRGITEAANFDFYLQSHKCLQMATARPSHYFVLHDEIFATPARRRAATGPAGGAADAASALHEFVHAMNFLFGRSTTAVSIVPAAFYAHLICDRGRRYLERVLAQDGDDGRSSVAGSAAAGPRMSLAAGAGAATGAAANANANANENQNPNSKRITLPKIVSQAEKLARREERKRTERREWRLSEAAKFEGRLDVHAKVKDMMFYI